MFHPHTHCCNCGEDNRDDAPGYAGERACRRCGFGGDGAPLPATAFLYTPAAGAWQNRRPA